MTVTRNTDTDSISYTNVKMCVITDEGLCQIMREEGGTRHLDTFTTEKQVTIVKPAES